MSQLVLSTTSLSIEPDSKQKLLVTLTNESMLTDQFKLKIDELPDDWYTIENNDLTLFAGESAQLTVQLHPGSDALPGTYRFTVTAEASIFGNIDETLSVDLTVLQSTGNHSRQESSEPAQTVPEHVPAASPGPAPVAPVADYQGPPGKAAVVAAPVIASTPQNTFEPPREQPAPAAAGINLPVAAITVEPVDPAGRQPSPAQPVMQETPVSTTRLVLSTTECTVEPEAEQEFSVTIENGEMLTDHFVLTLQDLPAPWYTLAQSEITLFPGEIESLPVKIHPPTSARPGIYAFKISATGSMLPEPVESEVAYLTILVRAGQAEVEITSVLAAATTRAAGDQLTPVIEPPAEPAPAQLIPAEQEPLPLETVEAAAAAETLVPEIPVEVPAPLDDIPAPVSAGAATPEPETEQDAPQAVQAEQDLPPVPDAPAMPIPEIAETAQQVTELVTPLAELEPVAETTPASALSEVPPAPAEAEEPPVAVIAEPVVTLPLQLRETEPAQPLESTPETVEAATVPAPETARVIEPEAEQLPVVQQHDTLPSIQVEPEPELPQDHVAAVATAAVPEPAGSTVSEKAEQVPAVKADEHPATVVDTKISPVTPVPALPAEAAPVPVKAEPAAPEPRTAITPSPQPAARPEPAVVVKPARATRPIVVPVPATFALATAIEPVYVTPLWDPYKTKPLSGIPSIIKHDGTNGNGSHQNGYSAAHTDGSAAAKAKKSRLAGAIPGELRLSATSLSIQPEDRRELTVTVSNKSMLSDQFALAVEGLPAEWYTLPKSELILHSGDRGKLVLLLHPTANAIPGSYKFKIKAEGTVYDIEETAAAELVIPSIPAYTFGRVEGVNYLLNDAPFKLPAPPRIIPEPSIPFVVQQPAYKKSTGELVAESVLAGSETEPTLTQIEQAPIAAVAPVDPPERATGTSQPLLPVQPKSEPLIPAQSKSEPVITTQSQSAPLSPMQLNPVQAQPATTTAPVAGEHKPAEGAPPATAPVKKFVRPLASAARAQTAPVTVAAQAAAPVEVAAPARAAVVNVPRPVPTMMVTDYGDSDSGYSDDPWASPPGAASQPVYNLSIPAAAQPSSPPAETYGESYDGAEESDLLTPSSQPIHISGAGANPEAEAPQNEGLRSVGGQADPLHVELETGSIALYPGDAGTVNVKVTNKGIVVDTYQLKVEGIDPTWYRLPFKGLNLFQGHQGVMSLVIKLPQQQIRARDYLCRIGVQSTSNPAIIRWLPLKLTVAPMVKFQLVMTPRRVRTFTTARYSVTVNNIGNTNMNVKLQAKDSDESCHFRFAQPEIIVPAFTRRDVQLQVEPRPKVKPTPGIPMPYTFTVTGTTENFDTTPLERLTTGEVVYTRKVKKIPWGLIQLGLILAAVYLIVATAPRWRPAVLGNVIFQSPITSDYKRCDALVETEDGINNQFAGLNVIGPLARPTIKLGSPPVGAAESLIATVVMTNTFTSDRDAGNVTWDGNTVRYVPTARTGLLHYILPPEEFVEGWNIRMKREMDIQKCQFSTVRYDPAGRQVIFLSKPK